MISNRVRLVIFLKIVSLCSASRREPRSPPSIPPSPDIATAPPPRLETSSSFPFVPPVMPPGAPPLILPPEILVLIEEIRRVTPNDPGPVPPPPAPPLLPLPPPSVIPNNSSASPRPPTVIGISRRRNYVRVRARPKLHPILPPPPPVSALIPPLDGDIGDLNTTSGQQPADIKIGDIIWPVVPQSQCQFPAFKRLFPSAGGYGPPCPQKNEIAS